MLFGVGGSGELAWRFSGFGEPKLPTELDDDAAKVNQSWINETEW